MLYIAFIFIFSFIIFLFDDLYILLSGTLTTPKKK
jgi:hypothetical protein